VQKRGGNIELKGNWIVHQYAGSEGFLGWLILQPKKHRRWICELEPNEINALGRNMKIVQEALRKCWPKLFNEDKNEHKIERIYVVCFSESKPHHIHFHIIPRTKKLANLLTDPGWSIYQVSRPKKLPKAYFARDGRPKEFPKEYFTKKGQSNKVRKLIKDLRNEIGRVRIKMAKHECYPSVPEQAN